MNPYQLLDRPDAPLFGHAQPLRLVLDRLNELHVCVIAPRLFGKSRLLKEVARKAPEHGFSQCLLWDLKRHTPQTNEAFDQSLAAEMERQLRVEGADLPAWFRDLGANFESIKGVFQELNTQGHKVLFALDGIESVLQSGQVEKEVWDNLRDLSEVPSVRFLTASRLPLRELCPPDSKTSPFWNIFHPTPVRLGAFKPSEFQDILAPFRGRRIDFDPSALKELQNWTGGVPALVMAVCERIFETGQDGQTCSKATVDQAAESVLEDYREHIEMLWSDLPTESQIDMIELAANGEVSGAGMANARTDILLSRGLAVEAGGNKLRPGSRIMEHFAQQRGRSLPEIKRLFSESADFERNMPEVLLLRLESTRGFDADAEHHIRELIKAIPYPETAKALIRNVADACAAIMMRLELEDGPIPAVWIQAWKTGGKLGAKDVDQEILAGTIPKKRGARIKLLRLLHEEDAPATPKTRRSTFLLLDTLSASERFGQHAAEMGEPIPRSFIIAIASVAVELLNQLNNDRSTAAKTE